MRELAPIITGAEIIPAMKAAVKDGTALQYRIPGTRKHGMVDITSANATVQVFEMCSDKNKAIMVERFGASPGHMAQFAWKLLGRVNGGK